MTTLVWDQIGQRRYETGVDRGVLYIPNNLGVVGYGIRRFASSLHCVFSLRFVSICTFVLVKRED